jgi:hypothetical protein
MRLHPLNEGPINSLTHTIIVFDERARRVCGAFS